VNAGIVMSFLPAASYVPEFLRARMSAALMFKMIDAPTKIDNMSDKGLKPVSLECIERCINFK
jgi:hypothetical protein